MKMRQLKTYAFKVNSMYNHFHFVRARTDEEAIKKMKQQMIEEYCWDGKPQYIIYWVKDKMEHFERILIRDGL